jgi:NADPH:quinone reductase-like Zn-dependent oxidoreductase
MGDWIGPLTFLGGVRLAGMFRSQTMAVMLATTNSADLQELGALVGSGTVQPVIDQVYPLEETAAAVAHVETGHARGKVVIAVP